MPTTCRESDPVGEDPADGAGDHGSDGEAGRARSGVSQVEGVDVLEVGRQVGGEGDEAAERHRVEERHLPRDGKLHGGRRVSGRPGRCWASTPATSCIVNQHDARHGDQGDGDDHVRRGVAEPRDEPRREERGEGGAAHAGAEHAGREPAPIGLVPGVHERDADRERRPGDAEEEAEDQQQAVRARRSRRRRRAARTGPRRRSAAANITRPPKRSVKAPARIRPSEPTSTGVATSSAFWSPSRPSSSV